MYRAMRGDGRDLSEAHPWSTVGLSGWDFVDAIFSGVRKGSRITSAFFHFSWSFTEARQWHKRGMADRGAPAGWMARVVVSDLKDLEELGNAAPSQEEPGAVLGPDIGLVTRAGSKEGVR